MSHIQERMKRLGIKQVDLILELRKRGITVQPPEMSSIVRGVYTYPKAKVVLDECDKILTEYESQCLPSIRPRTTLDGSLGEVLCRPEK